MIIANPLYDVVFKRLMENESIAKFFIGTLLEQTIEAVEIKPQELTYTNELAGLAVFRLDFIATIKTDSGERKKILIEIQKAKNLIDVMRFRNYLAEQYKKVDVVENEKTALPITTIYILGFTLPEVDSPCIKVARHYTDLIDGRVLQQKSPFIEKLTHDCFVVQVERITDRYKTRLDKLLSIFEQLHFVDDAMITKMYRHTPDVEEIKMMLEILHYVGTEPEERKQIEIEQEAWRTVDAMLADEKKKFLNALTVIAEKETVIAEQGNTIAEQGNTIAEQEKLIAELLQKLNSPK